MDLFYWGSGKTDDVVLTSAQFIGLERVDSRWCNHYVYQQSGVIYERCGPNWYPPQYVGTTVQYVVVNLPR